MSFAGAAAGGGGLSGMFWNPAVIGEFEGLNTDSSAALIAPNATITGDASDGMGSLGMPASSGNIGELALVPASYASYQISEDIVAGVSMNAPFGLSNEAGDFWAGQTFNTGSALATYNGQLAIAYNMSPEFTIGGGLMLEYASAELLRAADTTATSLDVVLEGAGIGFGFTAGATWRPVEGTHLGIGYRSAIKHTLEGDISVPGSAVPPAAAGADVEVDATLPEIVTFSLRQDVSEMTRLLATAEWTNWSRLQSLEVVCSGAANAAFCPGGAGGIVQTLEFGWHDGYFFSAGVEHDVSEALTLRGGAAFEISPVRNPDERSLRVPDSDRIWLSAGASYQISPSMKANLAYTHIFFEEGAIDRTEGPLRFVGTSKGNADILSAGLSMSW